MLRCNVIYNICWIGTLDAIRTATMKTAANNRQGSKTASAMVFVVSLLLVVFSVNSGDAFAITMDAAVFNSGGGWTSNSAVRSIASIGEGIGGYYMAGTGYQTYHGSLNEFVLEPGEDTNGNGICDENDPDDDADGISDILELAGTQFDPTTPTNPKVTDSDNDGYSDVDEAAMGTNPLDANSLLQVVAISRESIGNVVVTWEGRESYDYEIISADTVEGLRENAVVEATVSAGTGAGDWKVAYPEYTNTTGSVNLFYGVRLAN